MTSHTHLSLDQRVKRLDRPIAETELWEKRRRPWPSRVGVARFEHPPIEAPADWPLDATRLEIDLAGEGLIGGNSGGRTTPAEGWKLAGKLDLLVSPVGETVGAFTPFQIHGWRIEGRVS